MHSEPKCTLLVETEQSFASMRMTKSGEQALKKIGR
jgi:hypothetical protein